ncbi:MAG: response regulator transcription factor [Lachnospiraceae bacterium]|nr:response regulator transcription factor [Lachnospiraceae bacterium]
MKLLIVEDDKALAGELCAFLRRWGYETAVPARFDRIDEEFSGVMPQLVLMDINLPYYDGFYWCSQIRRFSQVPVIFISSRSDDRDKIMAIAQGGDDYVEKPFHLELLKAKIEAVLRRTYQYQVREQILVSQNLSYDGRSGTLYYDGAVVELTRLEKRIIRKLLENRPAVVSREELMMDLWDTDEYVSDGTLTTVVSRLRSKLKACCGEELIGTKKRQGYFIQTPAGAAPAVSGTIEGTADQKGGIWHFPI